jgi:hypothetical protein
MLLRRATPLTLKLTSQAGGHTMCLCAYQEADLQLEW